MASQRIISHRASCPRPIADASPSAEINKNRGLSISSPLSRIFTRSWRARRLPCPRSGYSDEAGRGYRSEAGRCSDVKPATIPI